MVGGPRADQPARRGPDRRSRKGGWRAYRAGQRAFSCPSSSLSVTLSLETFRPSYVRSVAADPLEASPAVVKRSSS
jgi:hypothetical protein